MSVIQGVRAFDPGLGSFTTPDAYAGDIKDPISQKPFIWDHNNPIAYSDPSGYNSEDNDEARLLGIRGFNSRTMDSIRKALGLSNDEKLPKFSENENKLNHTFNERPGHVPDTPLNRVLIQDTAAKGTVIKSEPTSNGGTFTVRATLLQNGKEVWSQTCTNSSGKSTISDGGIGAPKYLDPATGQPVSTSK